MSKKSRNRNRSRNREHHDRYASHKRYYYESIRFDEPQQLNHKNKPKKIKHGRSYTEQIDQIALEIFGPNDNIYTNRQ